MILAVDVGKDGDGVVVLVLDPVVAGWQPPYPTYGQATCGSCPGWVWLGSESFDMVANGYAEPICQPCAVGVITPDTPLLGWVKDRGRGGAG
jgi:hypothetical protein